MHLGVEAAISSACTWQICWYFHLLASTESRPLGRGGLRTRMEARVEATDGNRPQQALASSIGEVVNLREVREAAQ